VGGLVATREEKHLTLSTAELFGPSWMSRKVPPSVFSEERIG